MGTITRQGHTVQCNFCGGLGPMRDTEKEAWDVAVGLGFKRFDVRSKSPQYVQGSPVEAALCPSCIEVTLSVLVPPTQITGPYRRQGT
jgi:hypothetical protein